MRRRSSASSSSGTWTRNDRMLVLSVAVLARAPVVFPASVTGDLLSPGAIPVCIPVRVFAFPAPRSVRDLYAEAAWSARHAYLPICAWPRVHRTRAQNVTRWPSPGAPYRHICARAALRTQRRFRARVGRRSVRDPGVVLCSDVRRERTPADRRSVAVAPRRGPGRIRLSQWSSRTAARHMRFCEGVERPLTIPGRRPGGR